MHIYLRSGGLLLTCCLMLPVYAGETGGDQNEGKPPAWDPIEAYPTREILGWTIRVHEDLINEQPELCEQTLTLLEHQLYQVTRVVPAEALVKLKLINIWVEAAHPRHPCMCYHVSPDWLRDHDMNPAKAHCVELANCQNFLKWTHDQPWMVLHELAHGYHDQFLDNGYDNPDVEAAFSVAQKASNYEQVQRIQGRREKAYALTNPMEYFAELSEAYFGTNDFFPFVRSEFAEHDPTGYDMIQSAWGVQQQ